MIKRWSKCNGLSVGMWFERYCGGNKMKRRLILGFGRWYIVWQLKSKEVEDET